MRVHYYRLPPLSIGAPMALPTLMRSPISNICSRLAVLAPCAAPWLTLATSISDGDASSSSCSPVLVLAGAPHVYPTVTATDGLWVYQKARQATAQGRSQQGAWSMRAGGSRRGHVDVHPGHTVSILCLCE